MPAADGVPSGCDCPLSLLHLLSTLGHQRDFSLISRVATIATHLTSSFSTSSISVSPPPRHLSSPHHTFHAYKIAVLLLSPPCEHPSSNLFCFLSLARAQIQLLLLTLPVSPTDLAYSLSALPSLPLPMRFFSSLLLLLLSSIPRLDLFTSWLIDFWPSSSDPRG